MLALQQSNSAVTSCPFAQPFGRAVGGGVVENDKFETGVGLSEDTAHRCVQVRKRVVHRHHDADVLAVGHATARAAIVTG